MQLYFKNYSTTQYKGKSHKGWEEFGYAQLEKLYCYLGFAAGPELGKHVHELFSTYQEVPKGFILGEELKVMDKIYYLVDGTVKIYTTTEKEIVRSLINEGGLILSIDSTLGNNPSLATMEALTPCKVLVANVSDLHKLKHEFEVEYAEFITNMFKESFEFHKAIGDLLYLKNDDKLEKLYELYPDMIFSFPLKDIASLIGMEAETLSRTRKKLALTR